MTPFDWLTEEPYYSWYHDCVAVTGVITNCVLFGTLCTSTGLGTYRLLLMSFAFWELFTVISNFVMEPKVHISSTFFFCYSERAARLIDGENGDWIGSAFCSTWMMTVHQSSLILCYHFVYRLRALRPQCLEFTQRLRFAEWVALAVGVNAAYSFAIAQNTAFFFANAYTRQFIKDDILSLYPLAHLEDPRAQYYLVVYWIISSDEDAKFYAQSVARVALNACILFIPMVLSVFCGCQIRKILNTNTKMSAKTKHLQRLLVRALLVQTSIPTVFFYLPIGIIITSPLLRINVGTIGRLLIMLSAVFPAIDAVVIIACVGNLRHQFLLGTRAIFTHLVRTTTMRTMN